MSRNKPTFASKGAWIAAATVALLLSVLLPGSSLAQPDKVDLVLNLAPGSYSRDIKPGETARLFLEIRNLGSGAVTGIRFLSDKPGDWTVEFTPQTIDVLQAGSSRAIDVAITAPRGAGRGEHNITLIAQANETRGITSAFVRVQTTASSWLWIGAAIAALVIAGFIAVYWRWGRQ